MSIEVILRIPKDTMNRISELSEFFKRDTAEIINDILSSVSLEAKTLMILAKEYKVPVNLSTIIHNLLYTGAEAIFQIFDKILGILEAKGLYSLEDLEFDARENYLWAYFASFNNLYIDTFDVTLKPGLKELRAATIIENINAKTLNRLKEIVYNIDEIGLPEEFYDLEDYEVEVTEEEGCAEISIDCYAESVIYFPKIPQLSKIVQKILEKAEIEK